MKTHDLQPPECASDLHKHPLPDSFLHASSMADDRFDAGWDNRECPDCGEWGWEPPADGASVCIMCGLEIHFSKQWGEWHHNEADVVFCPGKGASMATPAEGDERE